MDERLRNHIEYNIWATERLLNAAEEISAADRNRDFGTADKSIQGTLTHLMRAERTWLGRVQRTTPPVPWAREKDEEWDTMLSEWSRTREQWRAWASGVSFKEENEILAYNDLKGNAWKQPIWQIILHVVNHSTHHRGQVAGFIRALGRVPPCLDFIAFVRGV